MFSEWWLRLENTASWVTFKIQRQSFFTCILYEKGTCWRWVNRAKTLPRGVKSIPLVMFTSLCCQTVIKRFFGCLFTFTSADTTRTPLNPNYKQTTTYISSVSINITRLYNFSYIICVFVSCCDLFKDLNNFHTHCRTRKKI